MEVERVNTYASKFVIMGWFIGLAYYAWFGANAPHIPIWGHAALVVVGMFAASIIIGGGLSFIAAGITKAVTGSADGSPHAFSWMALIGPVLAFFAAGYAVRLFA